LACNAAPHVLGAALSQIIVDDLQKPIVYDSKALAIAEKCIVSEKRSNAIVYAHLVAQDGC